MSTDLKEREGQERRDYGKLLDNDNDQQMLHRLDGPFATVEMIQEAIGRGYEGQKLPKRASANEPYTPLVPVPDPTRPEKFVTIPEAKKLSDENAEKEKAKAHGKATQEKDHGKDDKEKDKAKEKEAGHEQRR